MSLSPVFTMHSELDREEERDVAGWRELRRGVGFPACEVRLI